MELGASWLLLVLGLVLIAYLYGIRTHGYFLSRRVPYVKPRPFIGSLGPMLVQSMSLPDWVSSMYEELRGNAYGGIFQFSRPIVMLRDPELIKAVTVKDFDHFTDHVSIVTQEADPMWGRGVFNLQGQRWKDMRALLSPAFTSSKMRTMYLLVQQCGHQLVDFLLRCAGGHVPDKVCKVEREGELLVVELKDLFTRYTNDVIATTAFGVGVDSLMQPSNEFYLMGKDASNFRSFIWMFYTVVPKLLQMLKVTLIPKKVTNFFRRLIKDTMRTRDREGIVRPDLVQILMQARKEAAGALEDDDLIAQAFLFFLAGFDTASTLLCFACHQLATHPEVQTRLQDEIQAAVTANKGDVSYEMVHSLKYLDMVLSETLRLYPPSVAVDRCCVKSYRLPSEPQLLLQPGDALWVPIYALHRDPDHFPEPDKFDPERFSDENKHNIKPSTFLPFGSGPRICIGSRFALMEAKIALVQLLQQFSLRVVSRTPIPIRISKKGFTMTVDGGFWMGLEKRN